MSHAQETLAKLEAAIAELPAVDQEEITRLRKNFRLLVKQYNSNAKLAIICAGLEFSVEEGQ